MGWMYSPFHPGSLGSFVYGLGSLARTALMEEMWTTCVKLCVFAADINECDERPTVCRANQECRNTVGSYTCRNLITCSAGYQLNDEGSRCEGDFETLSQSWTWVGPTHGLGYVLFNGLGWNLDCAICERENICYCWHVTQCKCQLDHLMFWFQAMLGVADGLGSVGWMFWVHPCPFLLMAFIVVNGDAKENLEWETRAP